MKKIKMFAAAAMFCAAAFAGYSAYDNATMTAEEKLFQANIEALTEGEDLWDCENGCLDEVGSGCACYIWHPYIKEKDWSN